LEASEQITYLLLLKGLDDEAGRQWFAQHPGGVESFTEANKAFGVFLPPTQKDATTVAPVEEAAEMSDLIQQIEAGINRIATDVGGTLLQSWRSNAAATIRRWASTRQSSTRIALNAPKGNGRSSTTPMDTAIGRGRTTATRSARSWDSTPGTSCNCLSTGAPSASRWPRPPIPPAWPTAHISTRRSAPWPRVSTRRTRTIVALTKMLNDRMITF